MTKTRALAAVALVLGLAAPFAGSPYSIVPTISAIELAGWIRDQKPDLRVLDVRPAEAFIAYSIPTAENLPEAPFASLPPNSDGVIVVYHNDDAVARRAARSLGSRGHEVFVLRGGFPAWLDEVMQPVQSTELTRYFGGVARPAGELAHASVADRLARMRRRGC